MYNPKLCLHWRRQERLERSAQTDKYWGAATMEDTKIMSHVTVNHFIDSKNINVLCFRPRSILIALLGLGFLANLHKKEQPCLVVDKLYRYPQWKSPLLKKIVFVGERAIKIEVDLKCDTKQIWKQIYLSKIESVVQIQVSKIWSFCFEDKEEKGSIMWELACVSDLFCTDGGLRMASTVQSSLNQSQTQQCNVSDIHNATMIHITYRIGYKP